MVFSNGKVEQDKQVRKVRMKNMARKRDKESMAVGGVKRRTIESRGRKP